MRVLIFDEHAEQYRQALAQRFPGLQIVATNEKSAAVSLSREAEALFILAPRIDEDFVRDATQLRWIQALTSGTDGIDKLRTLPAQTLVTSTRGVHGPQMAEMA